MCSLLYYQKQTLALLDAGASFMEGKGTVAIAASERANKSGPYGKTTTPNSRNRTSKNEKHSKNNIAFLAIVLHLT